MPKSAWPIHREVKPQRCRYSDRKAKGPASYRGPLAVEGCIRPSPENWYYFPPPTLPWPDGLRASPRLVLELIPVVVPDFILLDFILPDFILVSLAPGPTLPSLDAPGAGCVCADAIAVAPNSEATTRAEIASLARMKGSPAFDDDA